MDDAPTLAPTLGAGSSLLSKPAPARSGPGKGMKLSKDKKNDILSALAREGEAVDTTSAALMPPSRSSASGAAAGAVPRPAPTDPITVSVDEKLTVRMNKEGGLEQMEVQGTLTLLCADEEHAYVQLVLAMGANAGMQFKTHPFIDKSMYASQQRLGVRDAGRPFPVNVPQGILIWRYQTTEAAQVRCLTGDGCGVGGAVCTSRVVEESHLHLKANSSRCLLRSCGRVLPSRKAACSSLEIGDAVFVDR
jgi:hypothetical protein